MENRWIVMQLSVKCILQIFFSSYAASLSVYIGQYNAEEQWSFMLH